ncbi:DHA2 family efflux MFS transporter permease subunit [Streptomyces sp. NBC_00582]|uniref:DHA2 family efflux MFS transporter permease subunit n=1 Tax=Streptomyces sp. NBC_00582 TaxID=2975783 RepID=UPI0010D556E9|nr:DHA2 family efflux MFS transporter permease subunit [Streptomyces sp. NBC_00582]WUB67121.1 DHA2 family efflux MFS transporter permease subunit [Streptomyces sp. NBC_00582]
MFVAANFMAIMDTTIVNVALPAVGRDFGVDTSGLSSVNVGYLVALAVFIPVSGWLGNRFGTRRTALAALLLFTVASGLCAGADSLEALTGYRVLQGIGGGLLAPVGMTMLLRAFPVTQRLRAQQYIMWPTAVAPALGPVLGGRLVDTASWHWVFLVNLPVGVLALLFGLAVLPDFPGPGAPRFDAPGFVLAGGGLAAVLYALTGAPDRGWGSVGTLGPLTVGVVFLAALVPWELRARHPMIDLRVMEDQLFRTTQLVLLPTGAAFMGVLYLYPQFLQADLGYDALHSGLATFPEALGMLTASQIVPSLHDRVGPRRLMAAGGASAALVIVLLTILTVTPRPLALYPSMYLLGASVGLLFASAQNAAFVTIPPSRTADATTLLNMQRQTAGAFGVTLAGTLAASLAAPSDADSAFAGRIAFLALAGLCLCASLLALRVSDRRVREAYEAARDTNGAAREATQVESGCPVS